MNRTTNFTTPATVALQHAHPLTFVIAGFLLAVGLTTAVTRCEYLGPGAERSGIESERATPIKPVSKPAKRPRPMAAGLAVELRLA